MKTKGLSKLLSVILTVAICLTTVLGCLVTVNAADSNCTYAIECVQTEQGFTTAKFTVKFDYSEGFTAGQFAVNESKNTASDGNTYSIKSVTNVAAVEGTAKSGTFSATDFNLIYGADSGEEDGQLEFITFETLSSKLYSSVTFEVTVKFDGTFYPGATYPISLSDVELADLYSVLTPTDVSVAGHNNFHGHGASSVGNYLSSKKEMDVVKTNETNGYTLYKTSESAPIKCSVCGEIYDYQLIPTGAEDWRNNYTELYGVNLEYNTDGTFNINVYAPNMADFSLYVTKTNGDFVSKITELSDVSSSMKDALPSGTKRFVIENLSARDIDTTFLLTPSRVDANGKTLWATTQQISIADYAEKVVSGDAVYTDGAASDEIEADKKVAAAVVLYGETAKEALATGYNGSASGTKETIYLINTEENGWCKADNTFMTDGQHGDGSKENPYVITKVTELRWLAEKSTYENTYGKYFEIDPTIGTIVMQTESNVTNKLGGLDNVLSADAESIKNLITTAKTANRYNVNAFQGEGGQFAGYLNGNGVEIVGLYSTTGLFGTISTGAVIENLSIKHSYVESGSYAGAICGQIKLFDVNNDKVTTFQNIEIADTYVQSSSGDGQRVGVFYGWATGNNTAYSVKVTNIFVHDSLAYSNSGTTPVAAGLVGMSNSWANGYKVDLPNFDFSDSVILGCLPYSTASDGQGTRSEYYKRIYTDNPCETKPTATESQGQKWEDYDITIINADDIKGSAAKTNMPNLDWDSTWVYGVAGEYPSFASPDYVAPANKTDTQTVEYFVNVKENGYGAADDSYLDGTHGDGSEEDPYVISSVTQLRHLVQKSTYDSTYGKYFEIDKDIDVMVLQTENYVTAIGGLDKITSADADGIKKLFTENTTSRSFWQSGDGRFAGHLDGNGVKIIGMYNKNGGLFCEIDNEATLENITLENCYVSSEDFAGVLFGKTRATNNGAIANISTITISDCYVESTTGSAERVGVLYGTIFEPWQEDTTLIKHTGVKISNIFVHDNIAYYNINNTPTAAGVVGGANNNFSGLNKDAEPNNVEFSNSIILDCAPYSLATDNQGSRAEWFSNIYTNYDFSIMPSAVRNNFGYTWNNYADKIIQINLSDIKGSKALTTMPGLDWNTAENTTGVWYAGNKYSYPAFEPATTSLPDYAQSEYDAMTFTTVDTYGESTADWGLYATSINVKTNPYMAFTFAFKGISDETAADVTVALTTESGNTYTQTADNMVHKADAGKYYLWRATELPVYELCGDITVKATYNGETKNFGTVSLEGFILDLENANRADPCTYYTTRINVAKAVMFYAKMLDKRYVDSEAVDLRNDAVKAYLTAETEVAQYNALSGYLTASNSADYQSVTLTDFTNGSGSYTVTFSEKSDYSNPLTFTATSNVLTNTTLVPNTTYYWKATATGSTTVLGSGTIRTKNTPVRFINIDGTGNVRDMGGWKTTNGSRVKYGMMYRGKNLDSVTATGLATIKQLSLKTEIDLRTTAQITNGYAGTATDNYQFFKTTAQYNYIFMDGYTNEVKANYKAIFELLSDESNYPFYTHCSAGADRTGTFAFITNGLLGVSYEDLTRDFELTTFSDTYARMRGDWNSSTNSFDVSKQMTIPSDVSTNYVNWSGLYKGMMSYGSKYGCTTLSASIEHWLVNYVGVPQSQIDAFRTIMLGD